MTDDLKTEVGEAGARLRALVATWRERERALCRRADAQSATMFAEKLAYRADGIGQCADALDAVIDALRSAPVVSGWQPIETAPKDDGQDLILADADGLVGHGFFDRSNLVWRWLDDDLVNQPTHWMPLPAAPVVTQEGEEPCP